LTVLQGSPLFSVQQVKEHFEPVKQSGESQPCLLGLLCTLNGIQINARDVLSKTGVSFSSCKATSSPMLSFSSKDISLKRPPSNMHYSSLILQLWL